LREAAQLPRKKIKKNRIFPGNLKTKVKLRQKAEYHLNLEEGKLLELQVNQV